MDEAAQSHSSTATGPSGLAESQSHVHQYSEFRSRYNSMQSFLDDDYLSMTKSPAMLLDAHRYLETLEVTDRISNHGDSHIYSSMVDGFGSSKEDLKAPPSNPVVFDQYTLPEANLYPANVNTPLSKNPSRLLVEDEVMGSSSKTDYGNALQKYHYLRRDILQRQQLSQEKHRIMQSGRSGMPHHSQIESPELTRLPHSAFMHDVFRSSQAQSQHNKALNDYNQIYGLRDFDDDNTTHLNDPTHQITGSMQNLSDVVHPLSSIPVCNGSHQFPVENPHPHYNIQTSPDMLTSRPDSLNSQQQYAIQSASTPYMNFSSSGEILVHPPLPSARLPSDYMPQLSHSRQSSPTPAVGSPQSTSRATTSFITEPGKAYNIHSQSRNAKGSTYNVEKLSFLTARTGRSTDDFDAESRSSRDIVDDNSSTVVKKRKMSKMHECWICNKKFPRPSGLKTHMNTHSNERPFTCEFPGCMRTFGVRSNAKRHLRTHGMIPVRSKAAEEAPYVVGFSTPMIMPPHEDATTETFSEALQQAPAGERVGSKAPGSSSSRTPAYKVRWMQPSSAKRSNPTEERHIRHAQMVRADADSSFLDSRVNMSPARTTASTTSDSPASGGNGLTSSSPTMSSTTTPSLARVGKPYLRAAGRSRHGGSSSDVKHSKRAL